MANISALAIGDFSVRQLDGLFSLNDLHRASGGEKRHQPSDFIRIDQTQALIAELNSGNSRSLNPELSSTDSQTLKTVVGKGKEQGTYACRELVIAYAAWISAAFHLKVIRVFLASAMPSAPTPAMVIHPAPLNQQQLNDALVMGLNMAAYVQRTVARAMVVDAVNWMHSRWELSFMPGTATTGPVPVMELLPAESLRLSKGEVTGLIEKLQAALGEIR